MFNSNTIAPPQYGLIAMGSNLQTHLQQRETGRSQTRRVSMLFYEPQTSQDRRNLFHPRPG
ncbi:hypothetical protein M7I_5911 [Glarea lozoyensis 74030]|uniref:Uncharacterized protein n=1 Tax=Glarea lozoyensis (strain ATCC 74030 / MF5533) TaxID=1104152 RepID=H0ET56_GLAL7|nr:hypothetical protein M7I_5911 [Glarea lozoyensis 74030]